MPDNHERTPGDYMLRAREAAQKLGVSRRAFYRLITLGMLHPGHPLGSRAKGWWNSELENFGRERPNKRAA